eukprot:1918812-Pleurochrysis_carterae.AAC.1
MHPRLCVRMCMRGARERLASLKEGARSVASVCAALAALCCCHGPTSSCSSAQRRRGSLVLFFWGKRGRVGRPRMRRSRRGWNVGYRGEGRV